MQTINFICFLRERSLNKKKFIASQWFQPANSQPHIETKSEPVTAKPQKPVDNSGLAPFDHNTQVSHPMGQYFVPGWKGDSLFSKNRKIFNDTLENLQKDVLKYLISNHGLSQKLQNAIYEEFISFSEYKALNFTQLDNYSVFWQEVFHQSSKYKKEIKLFFDVFSLRVATVYLLKVRFILTLQKQTGESFKINHILYPNSYFTKAFKTASSHQIYSKAFTSNIFSWYSPKEEKLMNHIDRFKNIACDLKIAEIVKTVSMKTERLLNQETEYSHTLSHQAFGLFINSMLINFPIWLDSLKRAKSKSFVNDKTNLEIISTMFTGDNIESLSVSHWLAQYRNQNLKWDQVLCPEFKRNNFDTGFYLIILNELQFLNFLAEIAPAQGHDPKTFITNIVNSHLYNRKNSNSLQKSLMMHEREHMQSTYDRVVLNLTNFPKNNPQHFLFNKIHTQLDSLKSNGLLYVMTSKKLFVPSQKSKIDNLLKIFKVEGILNLSEVSGKGELGSYIYIFSRKNTELAFYDEASDSKQTCLNFRFNTQLNSFHEFSQITHLTGQFFQENIKDLPPIYHKTFENSRMEFFQDAIVGGQLIHSTSKDSSNVTHPLFFKKLLQHCNPLDYFFDIQSVDFNEPQEEENSLFNFSQSFNREKSDYVIIVDKRKKDQIKLEFITHSSLEAKAYEYGHTLCSYFYAYKKWPKLDINCLQEFFKSQVAGQIINLTFSNELRKTKGNLGKVLIPKFFAHSQSIPEHILAGLGLLMSTSDQLMRVHPSEIVKNYEQIKNFLPSLVEAYPAHTLSLVSHFKSTIEVSLLKVERDQKSKLLNFNNPILKDPLLLSKTYGIYPSNKDIYIEFHDNTVESIHRPLTRTKIVHLNQGNYESHLLEVYSQDDKVLSIYSENNMIQFINFILGNAKDAPISAILQGIKVPMLEDLNSIISAYETLERTLEDITKQTYQDFNQLINKTIFH